MKRSKTFESRFKELIESKEYRKDFQKLKLEILSTKDFKAPPKIDLKKITQKKPFEWSSPQFLKVNFEKSLKCGWKRMDLLPLAEAQKLLKRGNINNEWVRIPDIYSDFKEKWSLEYFFDPSKAPSQRYDLFKDKPATLKYTFDSSAEKMVIEYDLIRYPEKDRNKAARTLSKIHKHLFGLPERIEKYSKVEIAEVRNLINEGMTQKIQIFRYKYPQFKSFNPRHDYLFKPEEERTSTDYDAWSAYMRVSRLVDRAKKEK